MLRHLNRYAVAAASVLFFGCLPNPCHALDGLKVFRGVLVLEGSILPGDYGAVFNFLNDESNFKKISGGVFLASPGGHVLEAIKIGLLIRRLRLSTDAPSGPQSDRRVFGSAVIGVTDLINPRNYLCTSACFLIYVAGIERNLNGAGRLGIHEPRVEYKPIEASENDVRIAKIQMRNEIKRYFEIMNVPEKYADLMYTVPANEVRWISRDEFDTDLRGYVSPIKKLIDGKCNPKPRDIRINLEGRPTVTSTTKEKAISPGQSSEILKCVTQVRTQLPIRAWREVFKGL